MSTARTVQPGRILSHRSSYQSHQAEAGVVRLQSSRRQPVLYPLGPSQRRGARPQTGRCRWQSNLDWCETNSSQHAPGGRRRSTVDRRAHVRGQHPHAFSFPLGHSNKNHAKTTTGSEWSQPRQPPARRNTAAGRVCQHLAGSLVTRRAVRYAGKGQCGTRV